MLKKIGLALAGALLLAGCGAGTAVPTTQLGTVVTTSPAATTAPETYSVPTDTDPVTTSETPAPVVQAPVTQAPAPETHKAAAPTHKAAPPVTQKAPVSQECSGDYYRNSSGNCVHRPASGPGAPGGATAICKDGSYSYSQHRSGTCSGHGGVKTWL